MKALDDLVEWSSQTKKGAVNALLSWFTTLNRDMQGAIVGALPQSRRPDFAKMLLQHMAEAEPEDVAGRIIPSDKLPDKSPGRKRQPRTAAKHRGQDESKGGRK